MDNLSALTLGLKELAPTSKTSTLQETSTLTDSSMTPFSVPKYFKDEL